MSDTAIVEVRFIFTPARGGKVYELMKAAGISAGGGSGGRKPDRKAERHGLATPSQVEALRQAAQAYSWITEVLYEKGQDSAAVKASVSAG